MIGGGEFGVLYKTKKGRYVLYLGIDIFHGVGGRYRLCLNLGSAQVEYMSPMWLTAL